MLSQSFSPQDGPHLCDKGLRIRASLAIENPEIQSVQADAIELSLAAINYCSYYRKGEPL